MKFYQDGGVLRTNPATDGYAKILENSLFERFLGIHFVSLKQEICMKR